MIKLYTAAHPVDAHLLRGALESAGIEAQVRGDFQFSLRGEAPVTTDTLPTVWILDDAELDAAKAIVREFEQHPARGPVATWVCTSCSEVNEDPFDVCWKCGERRRV
jgi:hypothetical protein